MAEKSPSSAPQGQTLFFSHQWCIKHLPVFSPCDSCGRCDLSLRGDSGAGLIYLWLKSSVTHWREIANYSSSISDGEDLVHMSLMWGPGAAGWKE